MGSGLILFVIVGAWLAVLVPMGLRSHDDTAPSRSVERFSDAMRVLARRSGTPAEGDEPLDAAGPEVAEVGDHDPGEYVVGGLRGTALRLLDAGAGARAAVSARLPRRLPSLPSLPGRARSSEPAARTGSVRLETASAPSRAHRSRADARPDAAPGRSLAAVRRRRVLLVLGVLAAAGLVAALVVPAALLLTVACALLATAFSVHCRRQARARAAWRQNRAVVEAELSGRPAPEARPTAAPVRATAPARLTTPAQRSAPTARPDAERVASAAVPHAVPGDQLFDLSAYEAPLTVPPAGVAPAARAAAPAARTAVRAALGAEWQPVPVPLPTYVGKAAAPAPKARPSAVRDQRQAHDAVLDDPGEQRQEVVERGRAAAAGW